MPEFNKTPHAYHSPTKCILCNTHEGPFIDTGRDTIEGHIYICCATENRSGCIRQMARLDDMIEPDAVQQMMSDLELKDRKIESLLMDIDDILETKTLTVEQLRRYVNEAMKEDFDAVR